MFPNLDYLSPAWPLTQHMTLITSGTVYDLMYAAFTYSNAHNAAERISEYMVANTELPHNIRSDSQLSDIWRDYQQVLAELGFMCSTKLTGEEIIPTPTGLALLDDKKRYKDILTTQVLLYQYPNGGKIKYTQSQIDAGVLIRPAALVWRVISLLAGKGEEAVLASNEIRDYLMRCCDHSDSSACADAIAQFRHTGVDVIPENKGNPGRNSTDWITFLGETLLFDSEKRGNKKFVTLSQYSIDNWAELNETIGKLELDVDDIFWKPTHVDNEVRLEWYARYGALRIDLSLPTEDLEDDAVEVEAHESEREVGMGDAGSIALIPFDAERLRFKHANKNAKPGTIESCYDAAMAGNKHRLHDAMIVYIADVCTKKGAQVYEDPKSLDLIVFYKDTEYLIEVKTISPKNYVKRLRYAVGQLLHYDFMLEPQASYRRKVIGLPNLLPNATALLPFLDSFLGIAVLSLTPTKGGQVIRCDSKDAQARELFSIT